MKFKPIIFLQDFIKKSSLSGIIIALISFIFIALISFTGLYENFEVRLYDMRFGLKPSIEEWDQLIFLDIDDRSILNIGEYPWPRRYYASALGVLDEVGARQLTFDMEFPNPSQKHVDIASLSNLSVLLENNNRIDRDELYNIILDNDNIFAQSIDRFGKVILPYHFQPDRIELFDLSEEDRDALKKANERFIEIASVPISGDKIDDYSQLIDPEDMDIAMPIPELINVAYRFGFTDSEFDADGIARKKKLIKVFNGRIYFEMALAILMDLCSVEKEDVEIIPGEKIILKNAVNPITYEEKDIPIPIDEKGRLYINWAGPGPYLDSFDHLKVYELLEYDLVKEEVHDFFDEQELTSGSKERSRLYGELQDKYNEYNNSKDLNSKRNVRKKISEINNKIRKIEQDYASLLVEEIKKIEEELSKEKDPGLEIALGEYKNYLKAINIVIRAESLRDKICIAGLVATGSQDIGATPTSGDYPMVGTYHNIVNTILNEGFIIKIGKTFNIFIMLVLALILGFSVQKVSARKSLAVIIFSFIIVNLLNIGLFALYNIWFEQLGENLAVLLPSIIIAGIKLMQEESQKRYIKGAFSHYLAPSVIDKIIESPEALELGGEEREITSYFSDVAKFSTISEKLTPPQLVSLLNEYLSAMTDIILSHGGTVDKYEGDAIIAFYGAPHPFEDHALRCCYAAIEMKKRLREMQDNWRRLGTDILQVRMGMNSGKAVVGNMGSRTRMDYTAMGDTVNLASRLEGANKFYSTYAMISESTYKIVKDEIEVRKLDIVRVVGKEEPIVIYELLGKKGQLPDRMYAMMEKYYEALELFGHREWRKAITKFRDGIKIIDDDGPSLKYIERCEQFIKRPPSKKWDGIYKFTSK